MAKKKPRGKKLHGKKKGLSFSKAVSLLPQLVINGRGDPTLRNSLSSSDLEKLYEYINQHPVIKSHIFATDRASDIEHLEIYSPFATAPLKKEIQWAIIRLLDQKDSIVLFLSKRKLFETYLLKKDYTSAKQVLDEIEVSQGQSIWLIKNRLFFLQESKGLEAQKKYFSSIMHGNSTITYIANIYSYYNEESVQPVRACDSTRNYVDAVNISDRIRCYLRYHVLPFDTIPIEDFRFILNIESARSIIDLYELVAYALNELVLIGDPKNSWVTTYIKQLFDEVGDARLSATLLLADTTGAQIDELQPSNSQLYENYLTGNFKHVIQSGLEYLQSNPHDFEALGLIAKSIVNANIDLSDIPENHWSKDVIRRLVIALNKHDNILTDILYLIRMSLCFSACSWGRQLNAFIADEFNPEVSLDLNKALRASTLTFDISTRFSQLYALRTRSSLSIINCDVLNSYTDSLVFDRTIGAQDCYDDHILYTNAQIAFNTKNYTSCIEYAKSLLNANSIIYNHAGIKFLSQSYICLGKMDKCLSTISSAYLKSPQSNVWRILPISLIIDKVNQAERQLSSEISCPIYYDIYHKHISPEYEHFRRFSYDDFMRLNSYTKPSEIIESLKTPTSELIYFLRHICAENVMSYSLEFRSQNEVANERIEICKQLLKIDPSNSADYQREIKNIATRITTQKMIRHVENSRVYIDVDGIKAWAHKNLKEQYSRYSDFTVAGVGKEALETIRTIRSATKELALDLKIFFPNEEYTELLESMVIALRDRYACNKEYGLSAYLSTRVRHGTLSNTLRRPLEESRLITEIDSKLGSYKNNTYWFSKLQLPPGFLDSNLNSNFNEFSEKFDNLIKRINAKWLQIRINKKGEGLFDFTYFRSSLTEIMATIGETTEFDEFLDIIISYFHARLDECLTTIREKINSEAKQEATALLNELQSSLSDLGEFPHSTELRDEISRARTEVQRIFNRVEEWFRRTESVFDEPFTLNDCINVAYQGFEASLKQIKLEVELCERLSGMQLSQGFVSIVDIIFNILINSSQHCGADNVFVKITGETNDSIINLSVINTIDASIVNETNLNKLEKIRAELSDGLHVSGSIVSEGGTGFNKIRKIIEHDLNSKELADHLDFGFKPDVNEFFVNIKLPAYKWRKKHENTDR